MNALENFLVTQLAALFAAFYGWGVDKIICLIFGDGQLVASVAAIVGCLSGASFFVWCIIAAVRRGIKKSQEGK